MNRSAVAGGIGLLAAAVAASLFLSNSTSEPVEALTVASEDRPNVLLLLWDTTRADRMSLYGHDRVTTPYLDKFSSDALVFERAVSPAIWTVPSHASLFTGLPVSAHGCHALWTWLDGHHVTMAEWLGQNGYDTYLFSSNVYVEDKTNLTQGFDTKDYSYKDPWKGPARAVASKKLIQRDRSTEISPSFRPEGSRALGWGKSVFKDSAPVAQRALMDWIDEREQGVPFFAFVNLMEAHSPRTPSIESRRELLNKEQITRGLETDVSQTKLVDYTFGDTRYSPDELEAIYGVYDASVLDLDKATGNLLDALEAKGLLENTIVVLTADHGENLGEHGHFEHRFVIYEPLIHVPLLIRYPKKVSPGRVSSETSNLGIFATILELTGLEPPDTEMEKGSLLAPSEGVAFAEIAGAEPVWTKKVMKRYPSAEWAKLKRSYRSVSAQGWKYVSASDGDEELYELSSDPGELKNAAEDELEQVKVMGAQLKTRLQNIPSYDRSKRATDDSPVRAKAGSETEQQLKMLGYVE